MHDDPTRNEELMKALSHPLRRMIVMLILSLDEPVSPQAAAKRLRVPLSNVSYHVRVLAKYSAVTLVDTQPVRGSTQHFYRPHPELSSPWVQKVLELEPPASAQE